MGMPVSPALSWTRPLIGRSSEVQAFDTALADPHVRGLVIHGPSGTGASRLADHLIRTASARGHHTTRVALTAPDGPAAPDPAERATALLPRSAAPGTPRPILLVDDIHLVRPVGTEALRALLQQDDAFLLATVRDGDVRPALVVDLERRDDIARLQLAPLDRAQTADLLRGLLGSDTDSVTLKRLHQLSQGNIRNLVELLDGLRDTRRLHHDGRLWRMAGAPALTPRLRILLEDRMDRAGSDAGDALDLLALAGAVALGDLAESAAPPVLQRLEERDLIEIDLSGRRATATLTDPLLAAVRRARIPLLRRRHILRTHAERIHRHGARRSEDLLLATRLQAAAGCADPDLLIRAAGAARAGSDHASVIALLDALPQNLTTPSTELWRGEAHFHDGDWQAADACLRTSAALPGSAPGTGEPVDAALTTMINLFWSGAPTSEVLAVARRARTAMTGEEARTALAEAAASILLLAGHPRSGRTLLDSLAQRPSTPRSRMIADSMRAIALVAAGRAQDALEATERLHRAHLDSLDPRIFHHSTHLVLQVAALTELGHPDEAEAHALRQSEQPQTNPLRDTWLAFHRGRCAWTAGRMANARRHYADAIAISETAGHTRILRLAYSYLAAAHAVLGDTTAAAEALATADTHPRTGFLAGEDLLGEAWLHAAQGRLTEARNVLETAAHRAQAAGQHASRLLLLTDLVRLGSPRHAEPLCALAERIQGPLAQARATYARAVASRNPDRLLDAARYLADLGIHGLAADSAGLAADRFRAVGDLRLAPRAETVAHRERQRLQGAITPQLATLHTWGDPLTEREREVALRASRRVSSKEIAAEMALSPRTVDNTLQRVYRKLGVTTRRDLAAALDSPD
ncbi:LuxR C-terminal-related transcriptional regulator [Streptomyces sp. SCSIO 30461]|uniref:helix-turn-helix transcriptional regulator n=1 Tax=Streptomyces sp. SCSIO 30461 TaxID=3118085 RepID=UPI0030CC97FA